MRFVLVIFVLAAVVTFGASGGGALTRSASASVAQIGGATIAFERSVGARSGIEIYLMNADGSDQRKLTNGCCFEWSPDGSRTRLLPPIVGRSLVNTCRWK